MPDGDGSNSSGGSKAAERQYGVYKEVEISAEMLTEGAREALKEKLGHEGPYETLVRSAKAVGSTPDKALEVVAGMRTLNGGFEVIADSAVVHRDVETKVEPRVKIS